MAASLSEASFLSKSQLSVVNNVLEDLKLNDKDVTIEPLGEEGDNYIADVSVIKVKGEDEKNDFRIIMKLAPSARQNTMGALTTVFFHNEILMYADILPALSECQEKAGVELKNAFQFATCYGFTPERQQEIILLEDLSQHGYTMLDKYKPLSSETVKLVLTSLADYHSMSYALKDKSPDTYKEFAKRLFDMFLVQELGQQEMAGYAVLGESFSKLCDKQKHKNLLKNLYTTQSFDKTKKLIEIDAGSKYSVIVHGDMWTNNILFRVEGDKTTDCIFIDYQGSKESMPVVDILYLIFNCTDYETRSQHYGEWIDHYHAQLEKSLFNFGLRVNNVYPREKLDSDLIRYAKPVLTMTIMALSILMRKNEESGRVKEVMNGNFEHMLDSLKVSSIQNTESIATIKRRLEGLMDSCFEFGLVNAI